jgi:hypothetical protein
MKVEKMLNIVALPFYPVSRRAASMLACARPAGALPLSPSADSRPTNTAPMLSPALARRGRRAPHSAAPSILRSDRCR